MNRYCYCSKVLPEKAELIRKYWIEREGDDVEEKEFWRAIGASQCHFWLQGEQLYIHCVEGEDLNEIFEEVHIEIKKETPYALRLRNLYTDTLDKDYFDLSARPKIERVFDIELSSALPSSIRKGFAYPLLPNQEDAYREFCCVSMNEKRLRHETFMKQLGVTRLTTWIQDCGKEKYILVHSEREDTPLDLDKVRASEEWNEIAEELMSHTGLSFKELTPDVEWLTPRGECASFP